MFVSLFSSPFSRCVLLSVPPSCMNSLESSVMKGITETNPYVDISTFFTTQVIPELSAAPGAVHDIIITDCLKYVSVFRQQLPKEYISNLMPILIKFLSNEQMVIHTYASYAIERLLSIKDGANLRLDKEFVRPHLQKLLEGLFAVLSMDESKENEYVMKAIMRVCSVGQDAMVPFASVIIQKITAILSYVSLNPRNPKFNHSMFETIAALIKSVGHSFSFLSFPTQTQTNRCWYSQLLVSQCINS